MVEADGVPGGIPCDRSGSCSLETPDAALLVLAEVVRAHVQAHGPRSPIVVGVAPERSYIAAVSDVSVEDLSSPGTMLARRGYFRAGTIEGLALDVVGTEVGLTSVVASSREWIKKIVEVCVTAGALVVRIEPTSITLTRLAFDRARQRKLRITAREHCIHLVRTEVACMAIWARGSFLLASRSMHLGSEGGGELQAAEYETVIRGLEIYGAQRLGVGSRPVVVVHGDNEVAGVVTELGERLDTEVRHQVSETVSAADLAFALSRSARGKQRVLVDLGRAYWPSAALFELIPQREVVTLTAAGLLLSAWMWWSVFDASARVSRIERQNALDQTLSSGRESDLKAERKQLEAEVGAVRRFVSTRRLWTPCLEELATLVPDRAALESIVGQEELTSGLSRQDKRAKRQLIIDFVADFPMNAAVPPEANEALKDFRSAPVISKAYPTTELASLRLDRNKVSVDAPDRAKFSILLRPRGATGG